MERCNRILAEEFLIARTWTSEAERAEALKGWNIHFNYHRPHSATAGQPPASRATGVTNVMAAYRRSTARTYSRAEPRVWSLGDSNP